MSIDKRIWLFLRLCFIGGSGKRADYLREKHIFGSIGENCTIMDRKIHLYANLIYLGNNVHIASQVTFITHDAIHLMLNNLKFFNEIYNSNTKKIQENIGCIEIGNNCFVGTRATILPNVKIGNNVIIGAGCLVNKDIPDNTVVVGIPAKIICSFDDFLKKRQKQNLYPESLKPCNRSCSFELANYLRQQFLKERE